MPKKKNNNRQYQLQYITRTSNNENKNTLKLNTETNGVLQKCNIFLLIDC